MTCRVKQLEQILADFADIPRVPDMHFSFRYRVREAQHMEEIFALVEVCLRAITQARRITP